MADTPKEDPMEVATRLQNQNLESMRKEGAERDQAAGILSKGCGFPIAIALVIAGIGAIAFFVISNLGDEGCKASAPRRDGLVLAACQKPADATSSSTNETNASSTGTDSSSSSAGTAGGGTAAIPPPASIPPGAILLQGQSGDNIGAIAADGQFRFVSLTGPGVSVGKPAPVETVWDHGTGKIVQFGANLHTGNNQGRYGVAAFRNVDQSYTAGCAIEVGQTSCRSDRPGAVISDGEKIVINVGEAGTGVGDYSFDWWFVFQPD
ncbi:MAG: hypothetical protein QOD92_922 [Acidimicrobiaceae bacterium]|jgi:hypothetical protein